jgi:trk system potassium uptake protein TrkA
VAQVAVIGLGRFGFHVAWHAYLEGHQVLAVSNDPQSVQAIKDHAHRAVVVDATDRERLEALGLAEFDVVVVSLGERIDASSIIVLHLREMGARRIIAKANTPEHGRLLELIGAHEIVFPERAMAERLARRLHDRNLADYIPLGPEHAIEEIDVPEPFAGRTLAELKLRNTYEVQVLAVIREGAGEFQVNPDPQAPLERGSRLLVLGRNADLRRLPGAR